ncbi:putative permease YjgP/YjgQ [Candidatus Magnetoovum chiemensis]|nr:putative permease YjgP/YjgQ [Candidatus Magnetoovum chiemensis]
MGLFDLIDKMDELMKHSPPVLHLFLYWLYIIPKYIKYLVPMIVLACVFFVFGRASGHNEITAIKASGGRVRRVFLPFVFLSVILALFSFVFDELAASPSSLKANDIYYKIISGKDRVLKKADNIWFVERKDMLINAGIYIPSDGIINELNVFIFDGNNKLKEILMAKTCKWDGKQWILSNITQYDLINMKTSNVNELPVEYIKSLNIYEEGKTLIDEMSFRELYFYNKRLMQSGYFVQRTLVEMYTKLAYPLTCIFTMLTGIALSIRLRIENRLINAAIALIICLAYWILMTLALSLGFSGIVPAAVSAFITPVGFSVFGLYLYLRIPQ